MKKLIALLSFTLLITATVFAQNGNVSSAEYEAGLYPEGNLSKAKEKIDAAVLHEKTMNKPKTYIVKSKVYRLLYKQSVEKKKADSKLIYEAFAAIQKAEEFDKKGDAKGKKIGKEQANITKEIVLLRTEVLNDGVNAYNAKEYKAALIGFKNTLALDEMDASATTTIDTAVMFNAAIAAYYDKQHDEAIAYLNQVSELGYGGETPFLMLYTEYRDIKDTVKMVETLKTGFEKYPQNEIFIKDLVVYYINNNKMEEGMDYINKALEQDPSNTGFLFAKGSFYDKQGNMEEAVKCYTQVIEAAEDDDTKYNANYNMGVIYYNIAVEAIADADAIKDYNKYKAAIPVAEHKMYDVVPYFEECIKIKPDDLPTLKTLSSVYYRLSKNDKEMMKKYEEVTKKIDSL